MKIKILKGLPGSGKTTWAKNFCHENKDWIRVNRDDLRNMRGDYWIPKQEKLITEWENLSIIAALELGYNVVLDATNLNDDRTKHRINELKKDFHELQHETIFFDVSLEECIKRDTKRENGVGEKVIKEMYERYFGNPPVVYSEDESLPTCMIVDIDGTLAKMNGRSPYDWDRVGEDKCNEAIRDIAIACIDYAAVDKFIIFTGRDGSCRQQTEKWLEDNQIYFDELYIREAGDTRKDSIVKREMFENHIRGKYYVKFVLDDRNQVVDMWRKDLGITCLQVDYGDF